VEEAAAAAESLVDQANQLADAISQFKLEGRHFGTVTSQPHRHASVKENLQTNHFHGVTSKKFSLDDANTAHAKWKTRLIDYMNGRHKEPINHADAASDHKCDLGKWIYGEGKQHSHRKEYRDLKETHAHFHQSVGEIVGCIEERNIEKAKFLLGGEFSRKSKDTQIAIDQLSRAISGKGHEPPRSASVSTGNYKKNGTDEGHWQEF
jgi:methyl-accepting chemotaxis protein